MQTRTKAELQMLREFGWFFFTQTRCYFCGNHLVSLSIVDKIALTFGHRRHSSLKEYKLTLHHIDEDRTNNAPDNLGPCHSTCHRSYHAKQRNLQGKEATYGEGNEAEEGNEEGEEIP